MRTIIIGDIHGCIDEFRELVRLLRPRGRDRLICLGDFMDKGPEPAECVSFARKIGAEAVLGNHEERHVRWRDRQDRQAKDPSFKNSMRPFDEADAAQNAALSAHDLEWLRGLPRVLSLDPEWPTWVAVHGGFLPGVPVSKQDPSKVVRARYVDPEGKHVPIDYDDPSGPRVPAYARFWMETYDGDRNVVYGHEAHSLSNIRVDHRPQNVACFGIDTGCVHGGHLTALVLRKPRGKSIQGPDIDVVQVKARQVYATPLAPIPA